MNLHDWDQRYQSNAPPTAPSPLVVDTVRPLRPGRALDLACGSGRNALWLRSQGWQVTAVDGSAAAIEMLRASAGDLAIETHIADLTRHEFTIRESSWDLILMCFYLQRDLFEPVKRGVVPGGIVIAMVHITEPGESPTDHRLRPGELAQSFAGWKILHSHEGAPGDPAHRRASAELVACNTY